MDVRAVTPIHIRTVAPLEGASEFVLVDPAVLLENLDDPQSHLGIVCKPPGGRWEFPGPMQGFWPARDEDTGTERIADREAVQREARSIHAEVVISRQG
jgi:hypothetical protein